jgi:hypothetical protein
MTFQSDSFDLTRTKTPMFALTRNEIVRGDCARIVSRKPSQGLLLPLAGDLGTTAVERT